MAASLSAELLLKYFLFINSVVVITFSTIVVFGVEGATATWCVARSDATAQALQTALDYACAFGADCTPLQSDGLCFLPNTIQAHASYAFNSYYQKKSMAPGSCDFSGTATIAQTDPSYGSCVYPSSLSTAGGTTPTTTSINSTNTPIPMTTTPLNGNGGTGGLTPGLTPTTPFPDTDNSKASMDFMFPSNLMTIISCIFVLSITLKPMLYVFLS